MTIYTGNTYRNDPTIEIVVKVDTNLPETRQAREVIEDILPAAILRFVAKNADYGDAALFLGTKGQFSDINRKFWKLKSALWDDKELIGESVDEILHDLIGHALLILHMRGEEV